MRATPWAMSLKLFFCIGLFSLLGCEGKTSPDTESISVKDQLGRTVIIPREVERIAALHHFGGMIVYALGQQEKLVERGLYGLAAKAMVQKDPSFAARPNLLQSSSLNVEELVALKPEIVFVYASFGKSELESLENAGLKVIALRGETLEESFEAASLVAGVLGCPERAEEYLGDCRKLLASVRERIAPIPKGQFLRVLFSGPKSVYTAATGEMLQTRMLEAAGAVNVAAGLKGFWADISPEQLAAWNPDVIFVGSTLDTYSIDHICQNSQFKTVKAVKEGRVYPFPSNIGWWDYPAPHCALGVVWAARALYPARFRDLDMVRIADAFYEKYLGYSFTALGGRL